MQKPAPLKPAPLKPAPQGLGAVPTARLWVAAVALAVPTIVAGFLPLLAPVVLACDVMLGVLAFADYLAARRARVKVVARAAPTACRWACPTASRSQLVNPGRARAPCSVRDDVPDEFAAEPDELSLRISGGQPRAGRLPGHPGQARPLRASAISTSGCAGRWGSSWHERGCRRRRRSSVFPDMRGASRLLLSDAALDLVNLGLRQLRRDGRGSRVRPPARLRPGRLGARRGLEGHRPPHAGR